MVGWQEGHPACRKLWVVGCWSGYLSGARCRLAYGPADATVVKRVRACVFRRLLAWRRSGTSVWPGWWRSYVIPAIVPTTCGFGSGLIARGRCGCARLRTWHLRHSQLATSRCPPGIASGYATLGSALGIWWFGTAVTVLGMSAKFRPS